MDIRSIEPSYQGRAAGGAQGGAKLQPKHVTQLRGGTRLGAHNGIRVKGAASKEFYIDTFLRAAGGAQESGGWLGHISV